MVILGDSCLGASSFFASAHPTDTCGTNGLPLTPNSIKIYGKFQFLRQLRHPNLCQYVDIVRGQHERIVIVCEHYTESLASNLQSLTFSSNALKPIAFNLISSLAYLHVNGIVHRNLSMKNILLTSTKKVKLSNFGLYYITEAGQDVAFPIGYPEYMSPEALVMGPCLSEDDPTSSHVADVWSMAMVLLDCYAGGQLWGEQRQNTSFIVKHLLQLLLHPNRVEMEDCLFVILQLSKLESVYENMDPAFKKFLQSCLKANPSVRPKALDLLKLEFFQDYSKHELFLDQPSCNFAKIGRCKNMILPDCNKLLLEASANDKPEEDHLASRDIEEIYYWWTLTGGDVLNEIEKHTSMKPLPPVLSLPCAVLNNGEEFGVPEDKIRLYTDHITSLSLAPLRDRLRNVSDTTYYPLIVQEELNPVNLNETMQLPLIIREKNAEYQFHRVILFERLLEGYPFTREKIIKEARNDIPPFVRARVWAALLGVTGDFQEEYNRIDKESPEPTDRQIEVDIPRCHQYHELLSSPSAHQKFRRLLKAWISSHPGLVYWQGLDSLSAPFLALNFNDEALAFASLRAFIPRYLYKFFLKDNSAIIQEYLAVFSQMIAFHDPELHVHLDSIGFIPELYSIPWFLTMFSHVFPLQKIFYLWDTLLLGNSMLPILIGVSVLLQLRDQLLSFGFNECILLFSDMPGVDIERCVKDSIKLFNHTPPTATHRKHDNASNRVKAPDEDKFMNLPDKEYLTLQQLKAETCPRISCRDLVRISKLIQRQDSLDDQLRKDVVSSTNKESNKKSEKGSKNISLQTKLLVVDVRTPDEFSTDRYPGSVNLPFNDAFGENGELNASPSSNQLKNHKGKIVMLLGNKGKDAVEFGERLVQLGYRRVCVMDGSISLLRTAGYLHNE